MIPDSAHAKHQYTFQVRLVHPLLALRLRWGIMPRMRRRNPVYFLAALWAETGWDWNRTSWQAEMSWSDAGQWRSARSHSAAFRTTTGSMASSSFSRTAP